MRILFSAVPAFGHFLPFASLVHAALAQGHEVALLTSADLGDAIATELPGVRHLTAGPGAVEFLTEVERRTGRSPMVLDVPADLAGYGFGDLRVELAVEESLAVTREWGPDVIIADDFDHVGPLVAAVAGVPWYEHPVSAAMPPEWAAAMASAVIHHYTDLGLTPRPALAYVDRCPDALQTPGWQAPVPRLALRPEPHTRPGTSWTPPPRDGRPRVLVTFGTVFNHPDLLRGALAGLDTESLDVIATLGSAAAELPATTDGVRYVGFEPLGALLEDVDVVVSVGGSGTMLGSLARGIPMVLAPQGADQPANAERVERVGAGVAVDSITKIGAGVAEVLADSGYRENARAVAKQVADMPSSDEVLAEITTQVTAAS